MKAVLLIFTLTIGLIVIPIRYEEKEILAIQNCFGESINIEIEFAKYSSKYTVLPEIKKLLIGSKIRLNLEYPEKLNLIETTLEEIQIGLPFEKIIITKGSDREVITFGKK